MVRSIFVLAIKHINLLIWHFRYAISYESTWQHPFTSHSSCYSCLLCWLLCARINLPMPLLKPWWSSSTWCCLWQPKIIVSLLVLLPSMHGAILLCTVMTAFKNFPTAPHVIPTIPSPLKMKRRKCVISWLVLVKVYFLTALLVWKMYSKQTNTVLLFLSDHSSAIQSLVLCAIFSCVMLLLTISRNGRLEPQSPASSLIFTMVWSGTSLRQAPTVLKHLWMNPITTFCLHLTATGFKVTRIPTVLVPSIWRFKIYPGKSVTWDLIRSWFVSLMAPRNQVHTRWTTTWSH